MAQSKQRVQELLLPKWDRPLRAETAQHQQEKISERDPIWLASLSLSKNDMFGACPKMKIEKNQLPICLKIYFKYQAIFYVFGIQC